MKSRRLTSGASEPWSVFGREPAWASPWLGLYDTKGVTEGLGANDTEGVTEGLGAFSRACTSSSWLEDTVDTMLVRWPAAHTNQTQNI